MRCGKYRWQKQSDAERCESFKKFHDHVHRHHREFLQYHRWFRYSRPVVLLFNLIILYLLFSWAGMKVAGICLRRIDCHQGNRPVRLFAAAGKEDHCPHRRAEAGGRQDCQGALRRTVECRIPNDLGLLIASFNEMASKLEQGEKIKAEYEENRKNLIANISHDLKTPITSIQGYIEALTGRLGRAPRKAG